MSDTTMSYECPWIDALQTVWTEVEQGQTPRGDTSPPAAHPGMTEQEVRDGILQCVRGAVGNYAQTLRYYRWARRHAGLECTLPRSPREMAETLVGPAHDPDLARPITEAIVKRIGELVG